jgi:hypothetical protein
MTGGAPATSNFQNSDFGHSKPSGLLPSDRRESMQERDMRESIERRETRDRAARQAGMEVEVVADRLAVTIGSHQGGRPTEMTADLRDPIGLTEGRTQIGLGILSFGQILPTPLTVDATAGTSSEPITLRLAKCQRTRAGLEIGT